ncbi:MAG: choice-of-anchor D domain-containing protein [Verrucomicrobiales bacterium]
MNRSHSILFAVLASLALAVIPSGNSPAAELEFSGAPEPTAGGDWKLAWSTVEGERYRLERSLDLRKWDPVVTLTAGGALTEFIDTEIPAEATTVFWRAVHLGSVAGDAEPPTVSILNVRRIEAGGTISLELTVQAQDNVSVVGVSYTEGGVQLGAGSEGPSGTWKRIVPLDPDATAPRQFQAVAEDAAGNLGMSEVYTFVPGLVSADFLPLDGGGEAAADSLVGRALDGSLSPFSYLPDGNGGRSPAHALRIDFPDGAAMVEEGGERFLEARRFVIGFGADSPVQIVVPDGSGPAAGSALSARGIEVALPEGETARLPVGELPFATLGALLGLAPGEGIRLRVHDAAELEWTGGVFTAGGIRGGSFRLIETALDLPAGLGGYLDAVTDLLSGAPVRLPLFGEIPFGPKARLLVTKAAPLVLEIQPGGSIGLRGPATLEMEGGVRLAAEVFLDDPTYCLTLRAGGLEIPLLASLADLLPADPASCIPGGFDAVALDEATDCLRAHERAYRLFIAAARGVRPDAPGDSVIAGVPTAADLTGAAAEAWASLAAADLAGSVPLQPLRDAIDDLSQKAQNGANHPAETLEAAARISELAKVVEGIVLSGTGDLEARLAAALADAKPAVLRALDDPRVLSKETLGDMLVALTSAFFDADPDYAEAARRLIVRAVTREAVALGIEPGATDPAGNPVLAEMNIYEALKVIGRLADIGAAANRAMITFEQVQAIPLFEETVEQVFARAYAVALADLDRTIAENSPLEIFIHIGEIGNLQAQESILGIPVAASPDENALIAKVAQAEALLLQAAGVIPPADASDPVEREQIFSFANRLRPLLRLADRLPQGSNLANSLAAKVFARLEELLPLSANATALAAEGDRESLRTILEAGILHAELRRRDPGLAGAFDWEGPPVGEVAARLAALAAGDSAGLAQLANRLIEVADELEGEAQGDAAQAAALRQSRKRYLIVAADVLARLHPIAASEWAVAEARRGADPDTFSADGFLPGDLRVDRVFGTVCFNRLTGAFTGTLGGQLRLPKLDSALEIQRATFDSDGRFDLAAHGVLRLPGTPDAPVVTMAVPRAQPLAIAVRPGRPVSIAGRARLDFDNGSFAEVAVRFADPVCSMRAETGGFDADLRDALLAVTSPQIGSLNLSPLWADYFEGFGNWLEGREESESPDGSPALDQPLPAGGDVSFDAFALLQAWLARVSAEAEAGGTQLLEQSGAAFREAFAAWVAGWSELGDQFAALFPPSAEERADDLLKRLQEIADLQKRLGEAFDHVAADPEAAQHFNAEDYRPEFDAASEIMVEALDTIQSDPDLRGDPAVVRAVVRAALDTAAGRQLAGIDGGSSPPHLDSGALLARAAAVVQTAESAVQARAGLLPGDQVDVAALDNLDAGQVEGAIREILSLNALSQLAGNESAVSLAHLDALADRIVADELAKRGFDPVSGVLDDGGTDQGLIDFARRLHLVYFGISPQLPAPLPAPQNFTFTAFLIHKEIIERAKALPDDQWLARFKLLKAAQQVRDTRVLVGGPPLADVEVAAEENRLLRVFRARGVGLLRAEEAEVLAFFKGRLGDSSIVGPYRDRWLDAAAHVFFASAGPVDAAELPRLQGLVGAVEALDALSDPALNIPADRQPAFLLNRVTALIRATAESARRGKTAATSARQMLAAADPDPETVALRALLGPERAAIQDAVDPGAAPAAPTASFAAALRAQSASLLEGSRLALAARAGDARPPAPPDLALPGDLRVERIFGGFFYHRITGFFRGTFGGKLRFPDPRALFEIAEATFDSLGNFAIRTNAGIPVKVLDNDRARLALDLSVTGSISGLDAAAGTGTLTVPVGPGDPGTPGTRTYQGSVAYDANAPGQPLTFSAAVDGVQNEFKLGDHFALFAGHLSVTFATDRPDITLRAGGKAGFFARQNPPPALGDDGKFWVVCTIGELELAANDERVRAAFTGGTLSLAADIFSEEATGAPVSGSFAGTLGVEIPFATGVPSFFGSADDAAFRLALGDLRFGVPGIGDSEIRVASCALELFGDRFPVLADLQASFFFPLPGQDAANPAERVPQFLLEVDEWGADGFLPENITVRLAQNIELLDLDGFTVSLLGGGANPTSLGFAQVDEGGATFTRLSLAGGMKVAIDAGLLEAKSGTTPALVDGAADLSVSGGAVAATLEGAFAWTFAPGALPALDIGAIEIEGAFLLGNVLELTGVDSPLARARISGYQNFFQRDEAHPFVIELTAAVGVPEVGAFALQDAEFVWADQGSLVPAFRLGGFGLAVGDSLSTILSEGLPLYVKKARLEFLSVLNNEQPPRAILPAAGQPGLFDLDNLAFRITAGAEFPPAAGGVAPEGPRFGGEVRDVVVSFPTGNLLQPEVGLSGIVMGIEGLDIPPLSGLTGQLALLNLDQLTSDPASLANVTFVGQLGGSFNGPEIGALLAASPLEFHGACLSVNAGVGIPLDGGVLGGILWTGAAGGIHFQNGFADPCEFSTFVQTDGSTGAVTGAGPFPEQGTRDLDDPLEEAEAGDDDFYTKPDLPAGPGGTFDPFDCLRDNWPPRAANPLCEDFNGRLVFKGSRLSAAAANQFLDEALQLQPNDSRTADELIADFIAAMLADIQAEAGAGVLDLLQQSGLADGQGQVFDEEIAAHLSALTDKIVGSFDDVARPILRGVLQPVGGTAEPLRDRLFALLTDGIPCFNVTFLGSGTFTHTAVAPVMDVKGTISVSTTGAALTRGELRLGGIPVAEASVGLSLTNESGAISPFVGGLARVGIGPLDLGKLTMSAAMPDAANIVGFFDEFVTCSLGTLQGAAAAQMEGLIEAAVGSGVPAGQALNAFLLARSDAEKIAVMGALLDYFGKAAEGSAGIATDLRDGLLVCFADFMAATLNALTPDLCFGGKVEPRLFDIPLTTSGQPIASARMRYGPLSPLPAGDTGFLSALGAPADLGAPGSVREFSAYAQFSPTALVLSPITAFFTPAFPALPGATAVDSAEFGFSFRQSAWTREKAVAFLTAPADYYGGQAAEFFNTAVFTAGYQLSPFGMKLADAQLRAVFPNEALHPLRPGGINAGRRGHPVNPLDGQGRKVLPTADEVILAALNAGRIKDGGWRGDPGQLDDLFPVPPATPSPDGCLAKTERVSAAMRANDPDLALLAGKSFAKDYFPYGGIIGGGALAMPKLLTQELPPRWGDLFTASGADWLEAFESVAAFLGSSDCIGQLAFYVPAPNPVLLPGDAPDWSDMTVDKLASRLTMDPASLIGRTINDDLYELDEIVFAGWADVALLGVPLGEARVTFDNQTNDGDGRGLEAFANIPPDAPDDGNWINDFFSGEARFEIALPGEQAAAGLTEYGFEEVAQSVQSLLAGNPDPDAATTAEVMARLADAMPKVSLEVGAGVAVPPAFASFIRGGADVRFFAYSPYFDPGFEPGNDRPQAVARRQGGMGIAGSLDLGFFPENPAESVFVSIPDASVAISAPAGNGLLPGLSANIEIEAGSMAVPAGPLGAASLTNLRLALNTDPAVGANFLLVSGETPDVDLGFVKIEPLAGAAIGGDFIVRRATESGPPAAALALRPAKITFPGLADNTLDVRIHGAGGEGEDFTLATSGDFGAAVTLRGGMTLRDPFNNAPLITLNGPSDPIAGSLSRAGDVLEVAFSLPPGFTAEFHPFGQTYTFSTAASVALRSDGTFDLLIESSDALTVPDFFSIGPPPNGVSQLHLTRGAGGIAKLRIQAPQLTLFPGANGLQKPTFALPDLIEIESTGRFYVNVGPRTLDLFGAVQAEGHLEFGFEPGALSSSVSFSKSATSLAFGSVFRRAATARTLTVTNTGSARLPLALELSGSGAANYHLSHSSLSLAPGESAPVQVTYIAKGNANAATLTLRPLHGLAPSQSVALSGATAAGATALGELVRSDAAVSFGQLATGLSEGRTALLMNAGNAPVEISNVAVPAGVSLQAGATGALEPGETRVVPMVYAPSAAGATSGLLSFATSAGTRTASLSGTAVAKKFLPVLQTARALRSLSMNGDYGTAVDEDGRVWETKNGGWSWRPNAIPALPATTSLQPKMLAATGSGSTDFKWLVGSGGEFWQANSTTAWAKQSDPLAINPARDWKAIARHNGTSPTPLALVAGNEGTSGIVLRETTPGKFSEVTFANTTLRGLATNTGDQVALAIGNAGKLFRSTNGGAAFSAVSVAGTAANLLAADISTSAGGSGVRTAVIGAAGGQIFRSTNSGASWSAASITAPGFAVGDIVAVGIEGARGLALDANGTLLTSSNSGASWTAGEAGFTRAKVTGIARSGSDFWALTEGGEVHFRIPDSGLQQPPLTIDNDDLNLGNIAPSTTATHTRTTGITNVGTTTLNLTLTPSSGVTVSPASLSLAPGAAAGIQVTLASQTSGSVIAGNVMISAPGFSKVATIGIRAKLRDRVWTVQEPFTSQNLIDLDMPSTTRRYALSSSRLFRQNLTVSGAWTEINPGIGSYTRIDFTGSTTGLLCGSLGSGGFIARTTNSGDSWAVVWQESGTLLAPGRIPRDIHMLNSTTGFAVTSSASRLFPNPSVPGILLMTTDGGLTWTPAAGPNSSFSGRAVHAIDAGNLFAISGTQLFRYSVGLNSWTTILTASSTLNDVHFNGSSNGVVTGEGGFLRRTSSGGIFTSDWTPALETFASGSLGRISATSSFPRFIGIAAEKIEVWKGSDPGGAQFLRDEDFQLPAPAGTALPRAIHMRTETDGMIVGDAGLFLRYLPPTPDPEAPLVCASSLDFGVQRENAAPATLNLSVANRSPQAVAIRDIIVENGTFEASFASEFAGATLAPNASVNVPVTFSGRTPGPHSALLQVVSDSELGMPNRVRLTALVQAEPAGLVARTSPPGLALAADGVSSTAAITRVIRDSSPGAGELKVGQGLAFAAPATQTLGGVTYAFSNWSGPAGASGPAFNFTAPNGSRFAEAIYRPVFPVATITAPEPGSPTGGTAPPNRPASGAWVRLSGAKLKVPSLSDFVVSGDLFLSGESIHASLASTAIALPAGQSPILEVGSGSWSLDWAKNGAFSLRSASPSVKLFRSDLLPSATAALDIFANGDFGMNLAIDEAFQDITGLFEIAPNGGVPASVGFSFANNNLRFSLNGRLRALNDGGGGWLVDQAVAINNSAQIFPQTFALPAPVPLGAFSITSGSLALTRNPATGVIALALNNLTFDGPLGTIPNLSASIGSDGTATFTQSGTVNLGPFALVPVSGSTSLSLNALTGEFAVNLPSCRLNSRSGQDFHGRWPQNTITLPSFSADSSGAFDLMIPLPNLSIDGIGSSSGGSLDTNHVRFRRTRGGTLTAVVRDRQSFFDNVSDLEFEVRSDGVLRGRYFGEMSFFNAQFGQVSMTYDSSDAPFQFQGTFRALDSFVCVECAFGTGGASLKPCGWP